MSRAKLSTDAMTCPSEIWPYSQQIDFPCILKMQSSTMWNLQHTTKKEEIKSIVTKEKFQITDRMTCATIRVIYMWEV